MQKLIIADGKLVNDYSELPPDLRRLEFRIFQAHGIAFPQFYEFEIPRGRGMYYCMEIFTQNFDPVNPPVYAPGGIFSTEINGRTIHKDDTILAYSTEFDNREGRKVNVVGWGGDTLKIKFDTEDIPSGNNALIMVFSFTQENGYKPPENVG